MDEIMKNELSDDELLDATGGASMQNDGEWVRVKAPFTCGTCKGCKVFFTPPRDGKPPITTKCAECHGTGVIIGENVVKRQMAEAFGYEIIEDLGNRRI